MNPVKDWRCDRQAGMTTDFPAHFDRQNEAHLKHRKQPKTTEADARAIRRSGGHFDCRLGDLPEAQLWKASAKGKNAAPRVAQAALGQKLGENGASTAAMPGSTMIRAQSGRRRRGPGKLPCPPCR